jgi:hypothetical protein
MANDQQRLCIGPGDLPQVGCRGGAGIRMQSMGHYVFSRLHLGKGGLVSAQALAFALLAGIASGCSSGSATGGAGAPVSQATAPSIVTQPQSQTAALNGQATFMVSATGTGPLMYQWTLNGAAISGATSATLQLSSITSSQGGSYAVRVSNTAGVVSSSAAVLTLTVPAACVSTNANCPLIYRTPPELGTGLDAANITGQRFGSDVQVYSELVDSTGTLVIGSIQALTVLYSNTALLQVQAPSNAAARQLIAVWVERVANGVIYDSATVYLNAPTINKVSEQTVRPGGQMYIWGRWLSQSDTTYANSSVIFRPASGPDIPATITAGNTLQLTVAVPATLVPGTAYSLVVGNGWGGTVGQTIFANAITAGASGADPLNLGVYWGANLTFVTPATTYDVTSSPNLSLHATGNGVTDDTAAVQAALTYVGTHGGGVVYAPAGTYKMTAELQILYPNTVLEGAGASTVFTYGAGQTASTSGGFLAFANNNVTLSGVARLTVNDLFPGTNGTANGAIRIFSGKANVSKLFLANVVFNLGQSYGMVLGNAVSDFLITGCTITQARVMNNPSGTADNGPISAGTPYFTFTNNTVSYEFGRLHFTTTNHQVVMGNTITVDGSVSNLTYLAANSLETGGIEFSFSDDVAYIKNNISVSPAPNFATLPSTVSSFLYDCFELLLSQTSQYGLSYYGTVSSATSTTLTDSSQNWSSTSLTPAPSTRRAFVAITDGPGIGQVRNVVSYTNNTITVDTPFDVTPTANASAYTVSYFVSNNLVVQDNTFSNGQVAVEVYSGGVNNFIRRNTIYGTHGIKLLGGDVAQCSGTGCASGFSYARTLAWHSDILNNIVDNEDSPAVGNFPAGIQVQTVQFENYPGYDQGLHGNTVFDTEVRNNQLTAHLPNVPSDFHNSVDGWYTVGAWGSNQIDAGTASPYPGPLVAVMGTVVSGNQAANAENLTTKAPITNPLKVTTNGVAGIVDSQNFP